MIPRLYAPGTTNFSSNGIGPLPDCARCIVTEERNGAYELEMDYVIGGLHYGDIEEDCIIVALPAEGKTPQGFRIYKIVRMLSGLITVYAEHISYILNGMVCAPFTANSCAAALAAMKTNCIDDCPFDFWTNKDVSASFNVEIPKTIRSMLSGSEGSILQIFGTGEYEFDNYQVKLYLHRGQDNGVTIRYGKNLAELSHETDATTVYTGIVPYWTSTDVESGSQTVVTLPEGAVYSDHVSDFAFPIIKPVDFSSSWQEAPTEAELRTRAQRYINDNDGWELNTNVTVSFVALWQTEEYRSMSALQQVHLCDIVTIEYPKLGVSTKARVLKTVFDSLRERYNEIEVGALNRTLGVGIMDDTLTAAGEQTDQKIIQNSVDLAGKLTLKGKTIEMTADNISINATNFQVDSQGNLKCSNAEMSGKVTATSGSIGGFTIEDGNLKSETVDSSGIWFHINSNGTIACIRTADEELQGTIRIGEIEATTIKTGTYDNIATQIGNIWTTYAALEARVAALEGS